MSKKLQILLITVLTLSLMACGGSTKNEAEIDETTSSAPTETQVSDDDDEDTEVSIKTQDEARAEQAEFEKEEEKVREIIADLDINECEDVNSANLKSFCVNEVSYQLAVQNQDQSYCSKIDDESYKTDCEVSSSAN